VWPAVCARIYCAPNSFDLRWIDRCRLPSKTDDIFNMGSREHGQTPYPLQAAKKIAWEECRFNRFDSVRECSAFQVSGAENLVSSPRQKLSCRPFCPRTNLHREPVESTGTTRHRRSVPSPLCRTAIDSTKTHSLFLPLEFFQIYQCPNFVSIKNV
jgi:hypothetical protein